MNIRFGTVTKVGTFSIEEKGAFHKGNVQVHRKTATGEVVEAFHVTDDKNALNGADDFAMVQVMHKTYYAGELNITSTPVSSLEQQDTLEQGLRQYKKQLMKSLLTYLTARTGEFEALKQTLALKEKDFSGYSLNEA